MTLEELRALLAGPTPGDLQLVLPVATLRELAAPGSPQPAAEELLTPDQAAQRLGVTVDWLYRRTRTLPFARKLSRKVVRYSATGLAAYLVKRDGAA